MTKLIGVLIIIGVLYGGWELFLYWEKVKNDQETKQKQDASAAIMGDQLPGMAYNLENSFQSARKQGTTATRNWLKAYGANVEDPRKAWIELDFCGAVFRDDPAEARRIFAEVKKRVTAASPVYPRVKQLEKTYE